MAELSTGCPRHGDRCPAGRSPSRPQEISTTGERMGIDATGGITGMLVTDVHIVRGWDLMRLVRSVTWLNRLRRSAINWRILRSACMTVV